MHKVFVLTYCIYMHRKIKEVRCLHCRLRTYIRQFWQEQKTKANNTGTDHYWYGSLTTTPLVFSSLYASVTGNENCSDS